MGVKDESVVKGDAAQRKAQPVYTGVLTYFPDALLAVAEVSRKGSEQHHPGEGVWWDKSKSTDEADALVRHLLDRGKWDSDGVRHSAKVAWRALALLQREIEMEQLVPAEKPAVPTEKPFDTKGAMKDLQDAAGRIAASVGPDLRRGAPHCSCHKDSTKPLGWCGCMCLLHRKEGKIG